MLTGRKSSDKIIWVLTLVGKQKIKNPWVKHPIWKVMKVLTIEWAQGKIGEGNNRYN